MNRPHAVGVRLLKVACALLLLGSVSAQAEMPSSGEATIRQALSSGKPTLVDVGARSCATCRKMAPILETLSGEYRGRAQVLFVDLNEHYDAGKNLGIQLIPTQIFFDAQGREAMRHIGFMGKQEIIQALKRLGVK